VPVLRVNCSSRAQKPRDVWPRIGSVRQLPHLWATGKMHRFCYQGVGGTEVRSVDDIHKCIMDAGVWEHCGLKCYMLPYEPMDDGRWSHWNGYVIVPKGHILHGLEYDMLNAGDNGIRINGGLTYAFHSHLRDGGWTFGFDTAHCWDVWADATYTAGFHSFDKSTCSWTKELMRTEVMKLAEQLAGEWKPVYEVVRYERGL